jgi:phosphatidate cytidylyltransferase
LYEIFSALGFKKERFLNSSSFLFMALSVIFYTKDVRWQFSCYNYTIIVSLILLLNNKRLRFKHVIMLYSMTVFISFAFTTIIRLRNIGILSAEKSSFLVFISVATPWLTDIGAYFGGKFFGKKKLCPDISPKKTVEGLFVGSATSVIGMILSAIVFERFVFNAFFINYPFFISICFTGSLISVLGDLFFSWFKRSCKIKDFGQVMPGHGGILDRFDSVIFASPFMYFTIKLFGKIIFY